MCKPTLLYWVIMLLACQSAISAPSESVNSWLDSELLPFLEDRLGRHPRLRGQPFELVAMKGNEILAETDGLTAYIRQRIIDRLQSVATVNRVLRPSIKPWRYPGKLSDLNCNETENATVQVGIEVDQLWQRNRLRVSVQAIDLVEKRWVRGFKKVWEGQPDTGEKEQLKRSWVDAHLLGTRALPFQNNQPDLLSSFLARNLSCLLQETGEAKLKVYTPNPPSELPAYFNTAFELLDHYLARFREVEITDDQRNADVVLTTKVHHINENLYQVWVGLQGKKTQIRLAGLNSEAYVAVQDVVKAPPRLVEKKPLIGLFELIEPRSQSLCNQFDAWTEGESVLHSDSRLSGGGCFALRYQASDNATVYFFNQTEKGQLTQLFPNRCNALGLESSVREGRVQANQVIHAPLFHNGIPGYFQLDANPGVEWVYAIAVSTQEREKMFLERIGQSDSLCRNSSSNTDSSMSVKRLQAMLNALAKGSGGTLQWKALRFTHTKEPPLNKTRK